MAPDPFATTGLVAFRAGLLAALLAGCEAPLAEHPCPTDIVPSAHGGALEITDEALSDDTIRIATFNIQVFGKTKRDKPEVMAVLVDTVRAYDLVAVQELKDASGQIGGAFLAAINGEGAGYAMLESPRTGATASTSATEQYAFYYDTATVMALGEGALYPDSEDAFVREPWVARFQVRGGRFSFVLVTVHTRPESAVTEVGALHSAVQWARERHPEEDDFIVLGDFNAACDYASPGDLDALAIRGADYNWIVPDDADTNLAARACAYDRLVTTEGALGDFTGHWGVDRRFDQREVSDHFPVWAEFFADRDGLTRCCRKCRVGQPCGNGCIPRSASCEARRGCACAAD